MNSINPVAWIAGSVDRLCTHLEGGVIGNGNTFWLAVCLSFIAILLACPDYSRFEPYSSNHWAAEALEWKFENPFEKIPVEEFAPVTADTGTIDHLRKRTFRIAPPLLGYLTGIGMQGMVAAQQLTSVLFLWMLLRILKGIFKDSVAAFFGSLSIACSFVGQWGFNDFVYFDGIAFFVLLSAMYTRHTVLISIFTLIAGFTDERAILATPLLYLYFGKAEPEIRTLRPNRRQIALVLGTLLVLVLRLLLAIHVGQVADMSGVFTPAFIYNLTIFPLGIALCLKGAMLLLIVGAATLLQLRQYTYLAVIGLAAVPCVVTAIVVYDFSRSFAYAFPLVLLLSRVMGVAMDTAVIRRITVYAATISLVMPTYYILLGLHTLLPVVRFFN